MVKYVFGFQLETSQLAVVVDSLSEINMDLSFDPLCVDSLAYCLEGVGLSFSTYLPSLGCEL